MSREDLVKAIVLSREAGYVVGTTELHGMNLAIICRAYDFLNHFSIRAPIKYSIEQFLNSGIIVHYSFIPFSKEQHKSAFKWLITLRWGLCEQAVVDKFIMTQLIPAFNEFSPKGYVFSVWPNDIYNMSQCIGWAFDKTTFRLRDRGRKPNFIASGGASWHKENIATIMFNRKAVNDK